MDGEGQVPDQEARGIAVGTEMVSPINEPQKAEPQPKTVKEASELLSLSGSDLIDALIESKKSQGDYVLVVGAREAGTKDQRVAILPVQSEYEPNGGKNRFLAFTADGPMALWEDNEYKLSEAITNRARNSLDNGFMGEGYKGGKIHIGTIDGGFDFDETPNTYKPDLKKMVRLNLADGKTDEWVRKVIQKNVAASESPVKAIVDQAKGVEGLTAFVKALPARA